MNFRIWHLSIVALAVILINTACYTPKPVVHYKPSQASNPSLHFTTADLDSLESIFIEPSNRQRLIGKFQKVEIGIKLPGFINKKVQSFLNNKSVGYPNPYDPDHINIEAEFSNGRETFTSYGFYYMEFRRDSRTNKSWKSLLTDYNWRIRFAPQDTGDWACYIRVTFPGSNIPDLYDSLKFKCIEIDKSGFIKVADDKRHFAYAENDEPFLAIGQNIPWTDEPIFRGKWLNHGTDGFYTTNANYSQRLFQTGFMDINDFIRDAANKKANMIRVVSWQRSYLFEWEERGVYGSNRTPDDKNYLRQKRAWELDRLFEVAEESDVKLIFCLEFGGQFTYAWSGGGKYSFYNNPYRTVKMDSSKYTIKPPDFFSDAFLKYEYKKKLRYFMARWGYSPGLGVLQLLSEFDGWSVDSNDVHHGFAKIISTDPKVQMDLYQWHDEMAGYVHQIANRPILVTSGMTSAVKPIKFPKTRNLYHSPNIDVVIWNRYGNDYSVNFKMFNETNKALRKFNKPHLYTETGLMFNPVSNADPGDIEGCSDLMFHNFLWAGLTSGNAGSHFEWWQHFDYKRRKNFGPISKFVDDLSFADRNYIVNKHTSDKGTILQLCGNIKRLLHKKGTIEAYYVLNKTSKSNKSNHAFGWIHNTTSYWANMPEYFDCSDRSSKQPRIKSCLDDDYNRVIQLDSNSSVKIRGFTPRTNFIVQWYGTYGKGGIIKSLKTTSNGSGTIRLIWPGKENDYGFIISPYDNIIGITGPN